MRTILDNMKQCTACGACANVCPKKCISMLKDEEGFAYPEINENECISCEKCKRVCPILKKKNTEDARQPILYACWSNDDEVRENSTSGGAFSEIAKWVLQNGGLVCGARYNEHFMVEHCIIDTQDDLPKIRQSKYVQSSISDVYAKILKEIRAGKLVAFCGCPCQTAGLLSFLGSKRDNLILIDFICRGSNSPKALAAFLDMLKSKYKSNITRVWFKNKEYGWNRFSTRVDFENGQKYLEDRYHDSFIQGYIHYNLYMRPCCYDCKYKDRKEIVSDITLGDFWGVGSRYSEMDTDKGTSAVFINTQKGAKLFSEIKDHLVYRQCEAEDASHGNPCLTKSVKKNRRRRGFLRNLDKWGFERCYSYYTRPTMKEYLMNVYYTTGHAVKRIVLFALRPKSDTIK